MATEVDTVTEIEIKTPTLYKVVLLNDDYTPMAFVIEILLDVFNKSLAESQTLMMTVHETGRGTAGIFTREIAEQKVEDTLLIAGHHGHPLKAISEPT